MSAFLRRFVVIFAAALLAACRGSSDNPPPTTTPWPTLAAVLTPHANQPVSQGGTGPQLVDKFRVEVSAGVTSLYVLEGRTEHPVRIEVLVLDGTVDPTIQINTGDGDLLALANYGGRDEPEVIGQFQFPGDGFYELGIGASEGSGQLGVSIYELEPATIEGGGQFDSLDQALHGTLAHPASYHIFQIPIERGQRFDLSATAISPNLDLLFYLYAPDGTLVEQRDDNIDKNPALWSYMPRQSGNYTVVLTNFDESTGDYLLEAHPSEPALAAEIGVRTEIEVTAAPAESGWVSFSGKAFEEIRIETRPLSDNVDTVIRVYDQYGNAIITANENAINEPELLGLIQLPFDGTYQVEFASIEESGTIEYVIRANRELSDELGGRILPSNFARDGEVLETGTLISYSFDLRAGDLISVAARAVGQGSTLDLVFDVYGPDGTLIERNDDDLGKDPVADRIEVTLAGRYVVTVWNYGGTIGLFELVIDNPEAPSALP